MGASEKTKYFVHHKVIALVNRSKEQNTVKGLSNDASITAIPAAHENACLFKIAEC